MTIKLEWHKPISNEKESEVYITNAPIEEINMAISTVQNDNSVSTSKPKLLKSLLEMKGFMFEIYNAELTFTL